ncbi:aspartate carbamoyltransferase catalytic subunit [Pseudoxanthomonas spadix]|uniref:aspartate carbamoyltransferase catalytic subunit n=1 Tax=Pseudoxanthomonas spadix TaxID=415229 RepID=UPI000EFF2BCB|nr:aspartate carbamoyltransferase catalytic subunit [Pseudoxanthomonas spadix]MBP3973538.1 aspartate carbamoyltransferase catalytic subunit [Pseudoxanthomonas spadix]RMW94922.1 aspartate carbamoyltransferase catalytic subunit [Pseudoxanthomonas spadix]
MTQLDSDGRLLHLLTLEGLPRQTLCRILDRAGAIRDTALGRTQKRDTLVGRTVCTLFFEPSTRTRSSFQIAAQRLGADLINFDASTSSARKGETALDTLRNLEAMGVRGFIVRHPEDGAAQMLARHAHEGTAVINAGDGRASHPTQGLLDMLSIRQAKGPDFSMRKIVMVGDIKHSRVARSDLQALRTLGATDITLCAPDNLLPEAAVSAGCRTTGDFDAALQGADVLMMLRLQRERMEEGLVTSLEDYHRHYGLTAARLKQAAPDAVVLHPGPINRGVEITDEVADGPQSLVLRQVGNGVAIRMAVLEMLLG